MKKKISLPEVKNNLQHQSKIICSMSEKIHSIEPTCTKNFTTLTVIKIIHAAK